jgi:hypothetical protein
MLLFADRYRFAFANLGRRLTNVDSISAAEIATHERRLNVRFPTALREYFLVAGKADDFNRAYDRILKPHELSIEGKALVFLEENQDVVFYGTRIGAIDTPDPPVYMAAPNEPNRWFKVNDRCSTFLEVMLQWEAAVSEAMPFGGAAQTTRSTKKVLDQDWEFVGEVNRMFAYRKRGASACFVRWEQGWRIFAGSASEEILDEIGAELNVVWEN